MEKDQIRDNIVHNKGVGKIVRHEPASGPSTLQQMTWDRAHKNSKSRSLPNQFSPISCMPAIQQTQKISVKCPSVNKKIPHT